MANRILQSLALAAGAGVALGFSAGLGRQRKVVTANTAPLPSDAETRIAAQAKEISALRAEVEASGQRSAAGLAGFERRLATTRAELPAAIESAVTRRVGELRTHLQDELRQTTEAGLARIDQAIDEKLSGRINALESAVADQSAAIGSMNRRAIETDTNLQRLISSVERLCDRAAPRSVPAPPVEPSFLELPLQAAYKPALEKGPVSPPQMFAAIK
jgi:uncharacterized coiled-coil protein SlyX